MPIVTGWSSWSYWANIMRFLFFSIDLLLGHIGNTSAMPIGQNFIAISNIWLVFVTFANPVLCFVILQELELVKTLCLFFQYADISRHLPCMCNDS